MSLGIVTNDTHTQQLSIPLPSTIKRRLDRGLRIPEIQRHGFTHPTHGHFLMLPPEFDLVLAHEPPQVAQVILEVMRQTVGYIGDGPGNRRLWAKLSGGHVARKGLMDRSDAKKSLAIAVSKGYLHRRRTGQNYEYAVSWRGIEYDT
jgi:hypothetical protein